MELTRSRLVGVAFRLGAEGIRWPSATGAGQSFALFVDQLQPGSHVDVTHALELTHDDLQALDSGTPLSMLIPRVSEYPLID